MSISRTEHYTLTCPSCAARFTADVWTLLDVGEHPELRDALLEGQLNRLGCPRCGEEFVPDMPLLLHDQAARRVYFAVPAGAAEHVWREQAQTLLYDLVAELPEEQRLPYLSDVQLEQELDGVRRALQRHSRRRSQARPGRQSTQPQAPAPGVQPRTTLAEAVEELLGADSAVDFERVARERQELMGEAAAALLGQMAGQAEAQGELELARALRQARAELARLRSASQPAEEAEVPAPPAAEHGLSAESYQAFLHADSPDELLEAARSHPGLLEADAGAQITAWAETALEEGNERLAAAVASRSEALAALRDELSAPDALSAALSRLLGADGEQALAEALSAHPILLTSWAQGALEAATLAARASGDATLATRADERRAMLEDIRQGLENA
jgi:hypothetical protein